MYYEYECDKCGVFTKKIPMNSVTPIAKCPKCNSDAQRKFSALSFTIKDGKGAKKIGG